MSYANEHACELKQGPYDRFRRKNCEQKYEGKCIDVIYGVKDNKAEVASLRYSTEIWAAADARDHCDSRGGTFEEASGEEEDRASRRWFAMEEKDEDTGEISIFDEIGGWFGQTLADFKERFDQVKDKKAIKVLVNSPGGDVFDGMAIFNLLSSRREKVSIEVLGVAASIASIIALAGKELVLGEGSYFMIHNPSGFCMGEAVDMRKVAEVLEKMQGQLAGIYADRSYMSKEEALAKMAEETWYTASEAMEAGLADAVLDHGEAKAAFDLARFGYRKVPGPLAQRAAKTRFAANAAFSHESQKTAGDAGREGETMDKEKLKVAFLALSEEERAQLVEELNLVDHEKVATLEGRVGALEKANGQLSAQLQEANQREMAKRKTAAIEGALKEGRIPPVDRGFWEKRFDADPSGTEEILGKLPKSQLFQTVGTDSAGDLEKQLTAEEKELLKKTGYSDKEIQGSVQ